MLAPRGFVAHLAAVGYLDGIGRIQSSHAMVLYEHARDTVAGCRHDEGVVETDFQRTRSDFPVPIQMAIAQTEVPLAHAAGGVTRSFQQRGNRLASGSDDQFGVAWQNSSPFAAPGVFAGEQGITRRRA